MISPKVQTIAGSVSGWAEMQGTTGTTAPNKGVVASPSRVRTAPVRGWTKRDAGGQELGAGSSRWQVFGARAVVRRAGVPCFHQLSLRLGGAMDVPQRGPLGRVRLARLQETQERQLEVCGSWVVELAPRRGRRW